jgi:hypothetical protein
MSPSDKSDEYLSFMTSFMQHSKGLGDVIARLRKAFGNSSSNEKSNKIKDIEKRYSAIQVDILSLINSTSSSPTPSGRDEDFRGPPVIIRCRQWEDFKAQATNANTVSFLYKSEERSFQVDALKEGRVYTFSGQLPNDPHLLRIWLSKELNVEESKVLEGILAIG